ncbi:hypothetical protein OG474_09700 [Kribbella sp. NBC_01505]|uniref:deoxynucleotide monophosphate kinase family protein n=1 Tax=Kribbella sp. NBC_01505 TaxID=2903580 RepID=UPI00386673BA
MATHLIGLLGRKRSGKDTFAARLVEAHGYKRFAFADNVRQAALDLDPWILPAGDDEDFRALRLSELVSMFGWELAKDYAEVRRVLQNFGTESIRKLDPDFWVRTVMDAVDAHDGPVVITDVRFPNEHHFVQARGTTVRITRPGQDTDTHISETGLDNVLTDAVIRNDRDVAILNRKADLLAASVLWAAER